jgi:hypothetical protein
MKIGEVEVIEAVGDSTHTYREDTRRKAPKWAFLGGACESPALDEGNPTVMAVATMVAGKLDGTCEVLNM